MSREIPVRFPPPLAQTKRNAEGLRVPVMQEPVVECGQTVRLGGKLVQCIRQAGHPVYVTWGHTNGYDEWCFDEEEQA